MTKAQAKKLETIIIKLELFQKQVQDPGATLENAKSRLISFLNAERSQAD